MRQQTLHDEDVSAERQRVCVCVCRQRHIHQRDRECVCVFTIASTGLQLQCGLTEGDTLSVETLSTVQTGGVVGGILWGWTLAAVSCSRSSQSAEAASGSSQSAAQAATFTCAVGVVFTGGVHGLLTHLPLWLEHAFLTAHTVPVTDTHTPS